MGTALALSLLQSELSDYADATYGVDSLALWLVWVLGWAEISAGFYLYVRYTR